jgi:protein gp37
LSSDQKETMDHIVTEWIVDEDQCFNAASTPGFSVMMATDTNCNYDGRCHKKVKGHVVQRKTSEGLRMPLPLRRRRCVVVDISDIAIISGITNMVKDIISGITNTPQKTYHIAQ